MKEKIAIFAYNFPHQKTQDFLVNLYLNGIKVDCIFAADPIKLNIPKSVVRTKVRRIQPIHPKLIAERMGINYFVLSHDSKEIEVIARDRELSLAIISGARILKPHIINSFPFGIINFHPGLIPEARGLDALLWSVYKDIPLGVTAHLIDGKIDAGYILKKEQITLFQDDTIFDISERLYEKQIEMLSGCVRLALEQNFYKVNIDTEYNRKMTGDLERIVIEMIPKYLTKFANKSI